MGLGRKRQKSKRGKRCRACEQRRQKMVRYLEKLKGKINGKSA